MKKLFLLLFWPLGFFLSWISTFSPSTVETYYTQGFSTALSRTLGRITGIIPFSIAEILILLIGLGLVLGLIKSILITLTRTRNKEKRSGILTYLLHVLIFFGVTYFAFMLIWGLNYNRQSFAEIADLQVESASESELVQLGEKLIARANNLRTQLNEDNNGVMKLTAGFSGVKETAPAAYARAVEIYPALGGEYGKPKPVFFSNKMSYAGISGIYFPFTAEANVNTDIPDAMLPAATCHELAHQRGFAREDEANYIAWVTCKSSESLEFQYSGTVLALIYTMNALAENHPDRVATLSTQYGAGLKRDLQAISAYWKKHEGKAEEITSDVNDAYLKSNRQEDGIKSYGRMVDLLLAEQKADARKRFL